MDIDQYYDQIMTEVEGLSSPLSASDSHDFKDENFSSLMLKHMSELGLTFEEPEIIRYFAKIGNANLLLSGYAIAGDGEDIDLYITNFSESSTLVNAPDREILKKAEACIRFLSAASTGKLGDKVDSRHPVYSLVKHLEFGFEDLRKIRVIVLTNSIVKTRSYKPREVLGKTIQLEVMDFQRFYNQSLEGTARDEIEINFEELGYKLPILWIPGQVEEYDYAVTVIPGDVLRHLYEVYGTRILEANVRSFLNTTGKTNAGILRTLTYSPERFMAYNNGIVILADEIVTVDEGQGVSLVYIKGMQIVNGGQTTASLYFGKRKNASIDLSNVRVAAKIVVPRKRDGDSQELLVSDISKYANTQNVVRSSDLSSNAAIHIAIEKIANKTFCPDGIGKWFYERSTGSYRVFLDREGRTPAGIKQLKTIIPNHRKILKTDVAKYLCAWEVKPNLVALGGQKNFAEFMVLVEQKGIPLMNEFDTNEFKELAAIAILYRSFHKIVLKRFKAFQANITAYTVALLARDYKAQVDLDVIWKEQMVSQALLDQMLRCAVEIQAWLEKSAEGKMISEWAKKPECKDLFLSQSFSEIRVAGISSSHQKLS